MLDCHFGVALVEDVVMIILVLILFSGRLGVGVLRFTVGVCNKFQTNLAGFSGISIFFRLWL